jgi:hypothetical protein
VTSDESLTEEQKRVLYIGIPLTLFFVGLWTVWLWRWCKRTQEIADQREAEIAVEAVEVVEAAHAVIQQEGGFHVMIAVQPSLEGVQGESA